MRLVTTSRMREVAWRRVRRQDSISFFKHMRRRLLLVLTGCGDDGSAIPCT